MCGISALYNPSLSQSAEEKFFELWQRQEARGRDATGIFAVVRDGGATRLLYAKYPVPASTFVPYMADYIRRHSYRLMYALGHARAATHGTPARNVNNHPIVRRVDSRIVALIHNGIVHERHCNNGEKISETDTEEILCKYLRRGVQGLLPFSGSATIGIIDIVGDDIKFYVARDTNPLTVSVVDDALVFGSIGGSKDVDNLVLIDLIQQRYMRASGIRYIVKDSTIPALIGQEVTCYSGVFTSYCYTFVGTKYYRIEDGVVYDILGHPVGHAVVSHQLPSSEWRPLKLDEITSKLGAYHWRSL